MKKFLLLSIVVLMFSSITAQSEKKDYSKELQKNIVEIIDNQYVINSYFLVKVPENSNNFQVNLHSTAPKSLISRDNFVGYTESMFSIIATMVMLASIADAPDISALDNFIMRELDEPIGEVDLSLSITMTKNGIQVIFSNSEGKENITVTWDEFFEN